MNADFSYGFGVGMLMLLLCSASEILAYIYEVNLLPGLIGLTIISFVGAIIAFALPIAIGDPS
jgi:hypothetical protein